MSNILKKMGTVFFQGSFVPIIEPFVTSGLVGYYDFNNLASYSGSGTTVNDISGQNNTLTFSSAPTFNSSPKSVSVAHPMSAVTSSAKSVYDFRSNGLTLEVLVNHNGNLSTNGFRQIFSLYNSNSSDATTLRSNFFADASIAYFGVGGNQFGYTNTNGSNPIPNNGWVHFVITCSGWTGASATINTYLNNTRTCTNQSQNSSLFESTNITYFFGIGSVATLQSMTGNIALVRVYNRALSTAEVSQNYSSLKLDGNPYTLP